MAILEGKLSRVRVFDLSADGQGVSGSEEASRIDNMRMMGAEAKRRGLPITACPNFADDALVTAWRDGWAEDRN